MLIFGENVILFLLLEVKITLLIDSPYMLYLSKSNKFWCPHWKISRTTIFLKNVMCVWVTCVRGVCTWHVCMEFVWLELNISKSMWVSCNMYFFIEFMFYKKNGWGNIYTQIWWIIGWWSWYISKYSSGFRHWYKLIQK